MASSKQVKGTRTYVYFPDEILGRGAMGKVVVARDRKRGTRYAAKVFNTETRMLPDGWIQKEIDLLKDIPKHNNIISTVGVEEETYRHHKVVFMELCQGGSLQSILEQPENHYGLPEEEFLLAYSHIDQALKHLYSHMIVHRDVKPGNILLHITLDGRHVYKLTDFGTAVKLDTWEDGFKTLCGTEEYLHPELYHSAFLLRIAGQYYNVPVDLWSFAVTLFQCATGKFPFRPHGGQRSDRRTLYKLMVEKEEGVISQVERDDGGIESYRHLPDTCQLTSGTKTAVEKILAKIFDLKYESGACEFFEDTDNFFRLIKVYIFSVDRMKLSTLYLNPDHKFSDLESVVSMETGVPPESIYMLLSEAPIMSLVDNDDVIGNYPETSEKNPIIVVNRIESANGLNQSPHLLPEVVTGIIEPSNYDMSGSVVWASEVCGMVYYYSRVISFLVTIQVLLIFLRRSLSKAVDVVYRNIQEHIQTTEQAVQEDHILVESFVTHVRHSSHVSKDYSTEPLDEVKTALFSRHNFCTNLSSQCTDIGQHLQSISLKTKNPTVVCQKDERCCERATILVKEAEQFYESIRQEAKVTETSHNDIEIHKHNKSELKKINKRICDILKQHCIPMTKFLYEETKDFISCIFNAWNKIEILEKKLVDVQQEIKCDKDKMIKFLVENPNSQTGFSGRGLNTNHLLNASHDDSCSILTRTNIRQRHASLPLTNRTRHLSEQVHYPDDWLQESIQQLTIGEIDQPLYTRTGDQSTTNEHPSTSSQLVPSETEIHQDYHTSS